MGNKIRNSIPIGALIIITIFLSIRNYNPGTWLSGWDTLHPEFNFGLNISRQVFGVFRGEQGLGAVAAHSHMADLPRTLILYLFHFFFPTNLLRYLYIFLNLVIGPLGMYFFLNKIVVKNKTSAFLGGLFYLLNLGTMQQFIVPFEMFVVEYGIVPWLFFFATEYLYSQKQTGKKLLTLFSLTTLLATPMAYAATLWYLYFFAFILYLGTLSLPSFLKKDFALLKKSAVLIVLSLLINSFWILPNIYFALTQGGNVAKANINVLFSPQAFLYNKEFGNLKDIALLKIFYFDWGVYAGGNHFTNLLQPFITHLNSPFVTQIGYLFALIGVLGLFYSIVNLKKNSAGLSLLPLFILALFFLINDNPPTSFIYKLLSQVIPLFREAFRFPGDKILGIAIFIFAIYFAFGQLLLVNIISKIPRIKFLTFLQLLITVFLLFYFMQPAFKGFLISPYMRIQIPSSYFDMFSWFNSQKDKGNIANLPIHSPWGWQYYNWYKDKPSFQGSGFISFGVKQPILDRDFDRWSPYNEQYYREMSYAVYSENKELFKKVIEKYNVHYILLDKSIIAPENSPKILFYKEIENMLTELETDKLIKEKMEFGKNLIVYQIANSSNYARFVKNYTSVSPPAPALYEDFAFEKFNDYITDASYSSYYPFRAIIDGQSHFLTPFSLTQEGVKISFSKVFNKPIMPSFIKNEDYIPADVFIKKEGKILNVAFYPRLPQENTNQSSIPIIDSLILSGNNNVLSINGINNFVLDKLAENTPLSLGTIFLKTNGQNTINLYQKTPDSIIIPDFSNINFSLSSCEGKSSSQVIGIIKEKGSFTLFGNQTLMCMTIPLSNLISNTKNNSRFLLATSFNYQGKPSSYMCLADMRTGACLRYASKNITSSQDNSNLNYFEIETDKLKDLEIKIVFDAMQEDKTESVSYSNIVFSITQPSSLSSFSQDLIKESIKPIENISSNTFLVPFSGEKDLSKNITFLPKTSVECNKSSSVSHKVSKSIISQEKENFIRYVAEEGTACDHFSYQNLSQNQAYLIEITSRNIKGLPLTMCVLNGVSRHCDLYANLTKSSLAGQAQFKKDVFLLPPIHDGQAGYDIDIGSLGIKYSESVNDLQSIQLIPFPYRFLSQIQTGKVITTPSSNSNFLYKTTSFNPSLYSISFEKAENLNGNLLIFSRSYNKDWKAYKINSQFSILNFQFSQVLPFIFGTELKNHVLANNWANGWIINSQLSTLNSQFVIIYLPQYLEYTGFILMVSTLIFILLRRAR